ncbi:trypsin-like peptidase domain-containing protein [Pseudolysinimonas sp.]|uniref:S1C family serine protease n=1 Tax=Pseudolysinimonas sp. TaxID=2680009 RepID=UPI00286B0242|nr:trypsin-like peptidase domain-containing protein [Pseudolysinimonas sp.]
MSESDQKPAPRIRRPRATVTPDATPASAMLPAAPAAPTAPPAAPDAAPRQRSNAGVLVAVAAVAALVGGGSGAGIAAWAVATNLAADQERAAGPQTITVNDPDGVNVVNAVAAKAGPSVVTLSVSTQTAGGSGSGVIHSDDGYVQTNNHVVTLDGASNDATIEVTTADGRIFSAEIVGTDPTVDLAVIKLVEASGLTPIEFGDVDDLDVGDRAVVIGAPLGLANTVTDGIVSVLDRSIQIGSSAVPDDGSEEDGGQNPFNFDIPGQSTSGSGSISIPVIQTDASINPGNSGGALVNDSGELIGIVVAIATANGSSSSGSIGVGFAIPGDLAERVANELIENGVATHGLLGATVRDASSADGSIVGAVVVDEDGIVAGGAAEAAGLRAGDIVTEFDGVPIAGSIDLTAQVRLHAAGAEAELVYVRNGEERTVTVTLGAYQP